MGSIKEMAEWAAGLEELDARLAPHFARPEPRQRVLAYVAGILGGAARRNGWQLAEAAGERTPYGMQRLVASAAWNADRICDDLRQFVTGALGDPEAVLVLDETGFLKKGANELYGQDRRRRLWLEESEQPFTLAVTAREKPWSWRAKGPRQVRVDRLAEALSEEAWKRLSAGSGSKGERLYDWAEVNLWR